MKYSGCSFRLTRRCSVPSMSLILRRGLRNFFCHELLPYHREAFTHIHTPTSSSCDNNELQPYFLLASFRAQNDFFMGGLWGLTRENYVEIMILLVYCVRKFVCYAGRNESCSFLKTCQEDYLEIYDKFTAGFFFARGQFGRRNKKKNFATLTWVKYYCNIVKLNLTFKRECQKVHNL